MFTDTVFIHYNFFFFYDFVRCPIQLWELISLLEQFKYPMGHGLNYSCGIQLAKNDFGELMLPLIYLILYILLGNHDYIFSFNRSITKSYYRNSVGALLIYDITNRDSFEHIPMWMNDAKRHIEPHRPVFVLVGCKLDLVSANTFIY